MLIQGGPREINPATISRNLYLSTGTDISVNRVSITEVEERNRPYLATLVTTISPCIGLINLLTADRYI